MKFRVQNKVYSYCFQKKEVIEVLKDLKRRKFKSRGWSETFQCNNLFLKDDINTKYSQMQKFNILNW